MPRKKQSLTEFRRGTTEDILGESEELLKEEIASDENSLTPNQETVAPTLETPVEPETPTIPPKIEDDESEESDKLPESLDIDQLAGKITDAVVSKITPTEQTQKESNTTTNLVNEELQRFYETHGRNPDTYGEQAEVMERVTDRRLDLKLAERDTAEQTRLEGIKAEQDRLIKEEDNRKEAEYTNYNSYWDEQLAEMEEKGLIPQKEIDGKINPDYRVVYDKLFDTMNQVKDDRAKVGRRPIYSLLEIYRDHFQDPLQQPAGANAPVTGSTTRAGSGEASKQTYNSWHRSDYDDIAREVAQELGSDK